MKVSALDKMMVRVQEYYDFRDNKQSMVIGPSGKERIGILVGPMYPVIEVDPVQAMGIAHQLIFLIEVGMRTRKPKRKYNRKKKNKKAKKVRGA